MGRIDRRIHAAGLHFFLSAAIALSAGLVVFFIWYPPPYAAIAGGWVLFGLMVGVDVVLGPCLTAVVASPSKSKYALRRDIAMIALVQLAAFGYGINTIAQARPVHLVFEVDRFRVVSATDIDSKQLAKAPFQYRNLPWTGPTLISARRSVTQEEMLHSIGLDLQGVDLAVRPERWVEYAPSAANVLKAAHPVRQLLEKYPFVVGEVTAIAANHGVAAEALFFLPLMSRQSSWAALVVAPDARIVGYLPVDGFF